MPIFGHLDTLPIRIWDESRQAINAYEMFQGGDFIVTHYDGKPDMWNTKPPLLIWFQVFFMKFIGINELSVRMPSAIAAFLTCVALLFFSIRYLKSFWFGFIVVFVLITTHGYINFHASRTGDYDALLTLFTTLGGLLFFIYCEAPKNKYLYLFFLCIGLAILTKSVTGLLFLPALFIYSVIRNQFIPLLKNKHFYFGIFGLLLLVGGYYTLREFHNPGYLEAVSNNELGGRYLETIEKHHHGFWYYFNNFIDFQLTMWYLLVPCGLILGLFMKDKLFNRVTLFSSIMVVTFFLIISAAQTKLEWYDVPMYPFISVLIAMSIYFVFNLLEKSHWTHQTLRLNVLPFLFLFLIGYKPYQKIFDKTYLPREYPWAASFYEMSYFLKGAVDGNYDLNDHFVLQKGNKAHLLFYVKLLNDKGTQIGFKDWKQLDTGDRVLAHQDQVKNYVKKHYELELIDRVKGVETYEIHGKQE